MHPFENDSSEEMTLEQALRQYELPSSRTLPRADIPDDANFYAYESEWTEL